jgi:schlafen family protein
MIWTRRHLRPEDLPGAFTALGVYERPIDGILKVVYTRQQSGPWTFYYGLCTLDQDIGSDHAEVYRNFAFISKRIHQTSVKALLDALLGTGLDIAADMPCLRLAMSPPAWTEELVPTYSTRASTPLRRFAVEANMGAVFPDSELVDFTLPYRASASRYAREFLGLKPSDSIEGRRGQFAIEIPDKRGAIRCAGGLISIREPATPLRLVGTINGNVQIDVRNDSTADYDEKSLQTVELWLVTEQNELVDFASTAHWEHRYQTPPHEEELERSLLEMIRKGESESCEFKPYVSLESGKSSEIEKTVCAFSNQKGGTLFLGVTDEGDIIGVGRELARRPDELEKAVDDYEREIRARLRESLKDNQCFTARVAVIAGTRVVVVDVVASQEVNYLVKSELAQMAYIRHGATNMKLSPPEMKAKLEGGSALGNTSWR